MMHSMPKKINNKRLLAAAQSIEHRLKKLPEMIRVEFRESANCQVRAMTRLERSIEGIMREVERQRSQVEKLVLPTE